ncbi:MAG TPA: hypothetical protein VN442_15265 [Bryobacteraceae bacterium]|nr:hypothetical protein [Bryobacteraceae bacterium]
MATAAAPPAKKKTSPLVWVLVAVVGLFILVGIGVVGAGFYVVHKARQAGLDPDLMQSNPALAVTKMLAAANPDIEVVRVDEGRGLITLREKSSGKTTTVDFEQIKKGRISFSEEGKDAVTFEAQGEGKDGSFALKSGKETMQFGGGADAQVPAWIPVYPGAKVEGKFSRQAGSGESGAFGFTTADAPKQVLAFYNQGLKSAGLKITSQLTQDTGDSPGGMIGAEDGNRKVGVMVSTEEGNTSVAITYEVKK